MKFLRGNHTKEIQTLVEAIGGYAHTPAWSSKAECGAVILVNSEAVILDDISRIDSFV